MADKSWLRRRVEKALSKALWRAYKTVRVDPNRFLMELRAGHGLPITSFQGAYSVDPPILDDIAESIIHSGMKMAAAEGAGFGLGGIITILPDFSILAGITLRTIQKLSLLYGFEYNTDNNSYPACGYFFSIYNCPSNGRPKTFLYSGVTYEIASYMGVTGTISWTGGFTQDARTRRSRELGSRCIEQRRGGCVVEAGQRVLR